MHDPLAYVTDLARRHYEEIGFLPAPRLAEYHANGQVWIANENADPCGFLVWGNGWPVLRVYQVCVQYDAQRRLHGAALIGRLINKAEADCSGGGMSTDYYFVCRKCKMAIQVASWGLGGFQFYRAEPGCMKALHKMLEEHTIGEHDIGLLTEHVIYDDDDYKVIDWPRGRDDVPPSDDNRG